MKPELSTDWTREEFRAYLLLFAANANFFESEDERAAISQLVRPETLKKMQKELSKDNDYQSIQKILYTIEKYHYSNDNLEHFLHEVSAIFDSDGRHDILEDNMLLQLKKLFKP
jgi:hypothetical protein